jgi:1,4-alpha-glucan branching enzyme
VAGRWRELLNSDAALYGGSGVGNQGGADTVPQAAHGHAQALRLRLPPLGLLVLRPQTSAVA